MFIQKHIPIISDNMEREEFLKYLRQGKYDKLAKLINSCPDILSFLDEMLVSNKKDDLRRALLVLKRLDNEIIEKYIDKNWLSDKILEKIDSFKK